MTFSNTALTLLVLLSVPALADEPSPRWTRVPPKEDQDNLYYVGRATGISEAEA
jgi:hypothetical protein